MRYTSASKSDELKKFLTIDEASFLKRHFVFRKDLSRWVAPIDLNSIFKSLIWKLPSKFVTAEEQQFSTIESALWELFFHLSPASFVEMRKDLASLHAECFGVESAMVLSLLPSFDDISERVAPQGRGA